jgi:hypothetical protein
MLEHKNVAVVDGALRTGAMERVTASTSLSQARLCQAQGSLTAVRVLLDAGLNRQAIPLLWDAARHGCEAVLQAEGLRVRGEGHHLLVLDTIRDQYGHILGSYTKTLATLRKARNEEQYPSDERLNSTVEPFTSAEVEALATYLQAFLSGIEAMLPLVPVYR